MAKNNLIAVHAFGEEVGRIGFDEHRNASFFQYRPDFFRGGRYATLFPFIIRKVPRVQVYTRFSGDTFRGLPPVIADSLPDSFGNVIFKTWLESKHKEFSEITVLEQLAYVGRRAMGALEYHPSKETKSSDTISINEMADVVGRVLKSKVETRGPSLDHRSLLNIFKIGSSVGGARAKILVSEEKETGTIIPGDVTTSEAYHHYLVKLDIEEDIPYSREQVEFAYYLTATAVGIDMMDSHMIDDKHFATLRY
ncbi:MAG TPA: HipA N-terminal domain-containing protein, partial [Sphingobacteriaceae bacterium]